MSREKYTPTEWTNRIMDGETVVQEGTPLTAEKLNNIEKELVYLDEYPSRVEDLEATSEEHTTQLKNHEERLQSSEAINVDHEGRIASSEISILDHEGRIASSEGRLTTAEGAISTLQNERGKPGGTATLNDEGVLHASQVPGYVKEFKVASNIASRDALEKYEGMRVLVTDATGDPTVALGWAEYVWTGTTFIKTAEAESMDFTIKWGDVAEKPTTFTPSAHNHTWDEVTGKPTTYTPSTHSHAWDEVTGKPTTFAPSTHSHTWGTITGKPTTFTPSTHKHTEADITDLDKYTKLEVDNKLKGKANTTDLHSHSNKTTLDKLTEGHLTKIGTNEDRIEELELGFEQSSHSHANKTILDKIKYSGVLAELDLHELYEFLKHTHDYSKIQNTPTIPSKLSDLQNDVGVVTSPNSGNVQLFVAPTKPVMNENDIWIVVI